MPIKEFQRVLKNVRDKDFKPIYFLSGPETYFIDVITNYIEKNALSEEEKSFNQTIIYGKDVEKKDDWNKVTDALKRYPMMSEKQVVIIKEAQVIKDLKEQLIEYLKNPMETTIFVVCYKYKTTTDKKLLSLIKSKGIFFLSKELSENKVPNWVSEFLRRRDFKITQKASFLLTEYLGNNLSKISNELEKLTLVLKPDREINTKDIEENIGISKDYNTFELINALGTKNNLKAYKIAQYFGDNAKQHPIPLTIGTLFNYFGKILSIHYLKDKNPRNIASQLGLNPFYVDQYINGARLYPPAKCAHIIRYIREADNQWKGIGASSIKDGEVLKELIYKILN